MALHVALTHRTSYEYDRLISLGPQTIRLRPAPYARTPILSYALTVEPKPHFLNWQQDPQGNYLARVVFPERVKHFDVTVDLVADMATINPFDFFTEPQAEDWPFAYDPVLATELAPFLRKDPPGSLLAELLQDLPKPPQKTVPLLVELNRRIHERVAYIVRMEPGVWSPEQTLSEGKGSCRDSAWLLVQMLRHLGFAARFVSGYLIQLVADVAPLEGPAGPSADFTDLHAWAEVFIPGAGWVGLDATSGLLAGEGHIPLAATPDPQSAAPISGMMEEAETSFGFAMQVTRVRESPRVTKPYSDQTWQDILATGAEVDRKLVHGDVRLTMGGEPTFVAADDMDGAEWNTDALGPTKRIYAGRLLRRLVERWSPGAALQHVMGKNYPGEQLPRWALFSHWRADHEPVWLDPGLLAGDDDRDTATPQDAAHFAEALAERLQIDPALVIPAYEDIHYYLWREHRLPANVLAEDAKLADKLERERLARVFGQGLGATVGSVLPLRRVALDGTRRWQSDKWFFRSGEMFLIPGDSPIGFRLPLESLPWMSPSSIEAEFERDPFAPRPQLPTWQSFRDRRGPIVLRDPFGPIASPAFPLIPQAAPEIGVEDPETVRTALAVESRDGIIHIFFPPLFQVEDWLDLAAAVEQTAQEFGRKVILEGYLPPRDPRLLNFSVTPDPGVIEVNVHPSSSWAEQVSRTEDLYEEARQVGLSTEKFMLDGRHVGTGGGNHIVMGGARPEDSPFLRRPDLLKSLLGYWHNNPALSYLFSGLFIGPTSQHPRVDEARQDAITELEIAFAKVRRDVSTPPWLTDRLFRNILADMTGSTHRTEFCIDKMYTPEGGAGRLGLVEYRAAEMPPHARMSAAQALLLRGVLAAFWEHPYERRLIRWGTRLHDDFMLPHFVQEGLVDALQELRPRDVDLNPAWFAPHWEFRFPLIGEIVLREIGIELRHALEPWHVLAEDAAAGATARYVDSSVERVQVKVSGFSPERYVLACNGAAVPLSPTGRQGEYVGGVRFKAWSPPSSLHPTIGVQSPLVFDLWDGFSQRSLGGLTHHITHPGGRHFECFPVNANEAEARRKALFAPIGHHAGPMDRPIAVESKEHPRTLDLRRAQ
jgi:uncharacterized protein (DUF2126 family)/transglutaminase-like putative cysteine protease